MDESSGASKKQQNLVIYKKLFEIIKTCHKQTQHLVFNLISNFFYTYVFILFFATPTATFVDDVFCASFTIFMKVTPVLLIEPHQTSVSLNNYRMIFFWGGFDGTFSGWNGWILWDF